MVKKVTSFILLILTAFTSHSFAEEKICPPLPKAQWIINQISQGTLTVSSLSPLPSFNCCKISTVQGETFFLSKDGKKIIEGTLLEVPSLKLTKKDYEILKKNAIAKGGKGKTLILIATNPLCEACRRHLKDLKEILKKRRIALIPVGFSKKEELAAIDSVCRRKNLKNFFKISPHFKVCDEGKLKVWSVKDLLRKYGITGTPVVIYPDGSLELGVKNLLKREK